VTERRQLELSEDQLERIAERSAEIVWENFQREVGKGTLRLAVYALGLAGLAVLTWAGVSGKIGH